MYQNAVFTNGTKPEKHQYVPWFLINGFSSAKMNDKVNQKGLKKFLCDMYHGPDKPASCLNLVLDGVDFNPLYDSNRKWMSVE